MTGRQADALADQARGGDAAAAQVFDTYGGRVGAGLVTLLAIFRPDRVVVAGSAARFLDLFGPGLSRCLARSPKYSPKPAVVAAELGNLSGAIGAAVMARPSLASDAVAVSHQLASGPPPPGRKNSAVKTAAC